MEFSVAKTGDSYSATFNFGGTTSVTEEIPAEALRDREQMFSYCERRLHALKDAWHRSQRNVLYKDADKDMNKVFEVTDTGVIEKATGKPAIVKKETP